MYVCSFSQLHVHAPLQGDRTADELEELEWQLALENKHEFADGTEPTWVVLKEDGKVGFLQEHYERGNWIVVWVSAPCEHHEPHSIFCVRLTPLS